MHLLFVSLKIKINVPSRSYPPMFHYNTYDLFIDSFINLLRLRDKLLDIVIAIVNMALGHGPHV